MGASGWSNLRHLDVRDPDEEVAARSRSFITFNFSDDWRRHNIKTKSISDCFRKLIFVISFFVKFLFWPLLFWLPVNFLLLVCYVPNEEEYMTLVYAYWRLNDRPTSHLGKFPTAISAMGYPIQLMFGTRKVFLVLADETLLPFGRIQDGTWPRCHL